MLKALLAGQPTPWSTPLRTTQWRARRTLLAALLWLLTFAPAWAQVNLYTFAQSTGTYTPITGGTVAGTATAGSNFSLDDSNFTLAAGTIPFTFTFNGTGYTGLVINTNGYVTFGATPPGVSGYTPISATTGYAGAAAAIGHDLVGDATAGSLGQIRYQTIGTTPNRTFVIQYANFKRYVSAILADNLNFQIRLNETSNTISFVYDAPTVSATATGLPQVGLRGASNAAYVNRTTTTNWSASAAGTTNTATMTLSSTVKPASGLTYTFSPPAACTAPPTAGTTVASAANGCAPTSTTLSLTGSATGTGVTYQWQQSATGAAGSYTNVSGTGTNATYTATGLTATTYFQAIVTCSGQSATSTPVMVTVNSATPVYAALPVTEGFESWISRCGNSEVPGNSWRNTPITGDNSWRRNDQGHSTGGWRYINDEPAPYQVSSSQGSYSARFHSYGTASGGTGSLDLFVDLSAAGTKTLTFDYINPTGTDKLDVLLSSDGGATFSTTPLLTLGTASAFGGQSITFTGTSATSVVRFRATSDFGNDDIGFDNLRLQVTPSCPGVAFSPTTSITSSGATVNFAAVAGATSYTVSYSPGGGSQTVTNAGAVPLTGLTPYTVYTVTVTTNCGGGQSGTATTSFLTGIGNNECSGAVALNVGAPGAGCSAATYTTSGATASTVTSPCTTIADGDVWFSFVATGPRHTITVVPTFDFDAVIELRSGACPGTNVSCQNASTSGGGTGTESLVATGLTNGQTYLVRVYSALAGAGSGNFDICITTPANLPCAQVTNAAVTNTGVTGSTSTASLTFDTAAGATDYFLTLTPTAGGTTVTGTLTGSPVNLTGLTPNTSYTLTISTNCSNGGASNPVTVVFTSQAPPAAPSNDDCAGATPITSIGVGSCGTAVNGTNVGATTSSTTGTPAPGCASYLGGDVWYSLTVPANGIVQVETGQGSGTSLSDTGMALYSGTCGSLALIECDDDDGTDAFSLVRRTGLTPGATIYVRVWAYDNSTTGTFTVCAQTDAACSPPTALSAGSITTTSASISFTAGSGNTSYAVTYTPQGGTATTVTPAPTASPVALTGLTPATQYTVSIIGNCSGGATSTAATTTFTTLTPPPPAPANDLCANAAVITCGQTLSGTTVGATNTGEPTAACGGDSNSPSASPSVFYSFVGTGDIVTVSTCGAGTTIDTELFVYTGSCGALTCVNSNDDFTGCSANTAASQVTFTSVVGTTYYFMVQRYSSTSATGAFAINVSCVAPPTCAPPTSVAASSITSNSASISFTASATATNYTVTGVYSGGTVTTTGTASPITLVGLTPSTQYTVTVTSTCAGGLTAPASAITFTTLAPAPANDNCATATPITSIGVGSCGTAVAGTNVGATTSSTTGTPAPGCASYLGGDVWYSLTVPANGIVQVETSQGSGTSISDTGLALYSGSCGSLTLISCNDDINSGVNNFSRLRATGLTPGSTIYARVWEYSNDAFGTFAICAQTDAAPTDLTVSTPQTVQGTYANVTITGSGAARLTGALTVTGTLTVQDGGILATNCQPITGAGSFVLQAGGHLRICDAAGISQSGATGAIQLSGTRSYSNDATYVYNGSAAQTTGSGLPARVRNLGISNSSGVTLTSPLQVAQLLRLTGSGDLTTNGQALTLLSSASGTALVVNRGTGVVNGPTTVQRYIDPTLNPGPGYRHYSAPVSNTTVADLVTGGFSPVVNPAYNASATPNLVTPFPTVFGYDEARVLSSPATTYSAFDKGWESPSALSDPLTPGRGYTVNIPASQLVDFVGTLTNGPVARGLARNGGASGGLHLVGNPYPAPIDWSLLSVPAGLDNAMYVFQSTAQYGGAYRSYVNGVGNPRIATGQGFFVRLSVGSSAAALTLTNALRDTSYVAGPSFNRGVETRPLVQLTLRGAGSTFVDEAYVYFENGATTGLDTGYDALKLQHNTGGVASLYALQAGSELSITGLPQLHSTTVVPLGLELPRAGSFTLEAAQLLNLTTAGVYLHDAATGQDIDLRQQPAYSFTAAAAGLLHGRFELRFEPQRPTAAHAGLTAASVSLFPNPAHQRVTLLVPAVAAAKQVHATLLNSLGQVVATQTVALPAAGAQLTFDLRQLATGVYTVRLQAGDATVAKRLVVE